MDRRFASRPGVSINLEQSVTDSVGVFARAGWVDGRYEAFEFTDVDRSVSGGVSIEGTHWHRPDDRFGVAAVVNHAPGSRRRFLNAGGLGILIGDGGLPHPGDEYIVESYYALALWKAALQVSVRLTAPWAEKRRHAAENSDAGAIACLCDRMGGSRPSSRIQSSEADVSVQPPNHRSRLVNRKVGAGSARKSSIVKLQSRSRETRVARLRRSIRY